MMYRIITATTGEKSSPPPEAGILRLIGRSIKSAVPSISLTSGLLYGTLSLAARSQEMATAPNIAHIIAKMA